MKNKVIILWCAFVVSLITTVSLWFVMKNVNPSYEEVQVIVLSSRTEQVINKKTGARTNFYKVKVEYNNKTYTLENVHNSYMYQEGRKVKAYFSNNKLFADVDGVKTSTPIATIYFIFLFGSFILLFVAATYSSKYSQIKKQINNANN